jgi:RNA polymerase sigma-70 factor (ECF subfamily)
MTHGAKREGLLVEQSKMRRFETIAVPHMDAAFNLARWLTRNEHDAEDVVQEAYLRAYKFIDGYRGGDARAWILTIVRRSCFTWLARNRPFELVVDSDDEERAAMPDTATPDPEAQLLQRLDEATLTSLIETLPPLFREIVVLREIEELPYKDIAEILEVPIGTVMSRLARARQRLQDSWRRHPDARSC